MGRVIISYCRNIAFTWNEDYVESFLKLTLQIGGLHKILDLIHIENFNFKHFQYNYINKI